MAIKMDENEFSKQSFWLLVGIFIGTFIGVFGNVWASAYYDVWIKKEVMYEPQFWTLTWFLALVIIATVAVMLYYAYRVFRS